MTEWGGTSGHMQVGINVRHDPVGNGTTSVNVEVDFYVRTIDWGAADNQSITVGVNGGGWATWAYRMNSPTGKTTELHVGTLSLGQQGLSYGGGPYYTFFGNVSDSALGANPSHTVGFTLPGRWASPPSPPAWLSPDWASGTAIRVQFGAASESNGAGVDAYEIRAANNPSMSGYISTGAISGGPAQFNGLTPGTTYWFQGFAHNGAGWSGGSGIVSAATLNYPSAPGAPFTQAIGPTSATVNWTGSASNGGAGISAYEIQLANNPSFTGASSPQVAGGPYNFTGLVPGTLYYLRARAVNSVGWGAYSGVSSFRTLSGAKIRSGSGWAEAKANLRSGGGFALLMAKKRVDGAWRN